MEELFCSLDDSLFSKKYQDDRSGGQNDTVKNECNKSLAGVNSQLLQNTIVPFTAKVETDAWFMKAHSEQNPIEELRFKASYLYLNRSYDAALNCNLELLSLVGRSKSLSSETLEAISRCFLRLADYDKSLEFAERLAEQRTESGSANFDFSVIYSQLLCEIYTCAGRWSDAVAQLTILLTHFDKNPGLWVNLAECLGELNCSYTQIDSGNIQVEQLQSPLLPYWLRPCSSCFENIRYGCLSRAAALYSLQRTTSKVAGNRAMLKLAQLQDILSAALPEIIEKLESTKRSMCQDLEWEDRTAATVLSEDNANEQPGEQRTDSISCENFWVKWFFWTFNECPVCSLVSTN